jgi:NADH-quinone oxidoreductase subunit M
MNALGFPILSWIIFLPLIGAAIVVVWSRREPAMVKGIALLFSVATFILSLVLYFAFESGEGAMQFTETASWIPGFGIDYRLGVDGISLLMVMLTAFLTPLAILGAWRDVQNRVNEFYAAMLVLETAMLGVFVALDLFLFYVFWEAMLIPMALLIGVWGGARRIYAAVKFFLFTMTGSVLMLVAMLVLVYLNLKTTGMLTFSLLALNRLDLPGNIQWWLFGAFFLAFAIKVPMFPFHTWLPDAHVEAPTAGSVILAGVLLKMGTYGFIRFAMPLFPLAAQAVHRGAGRFGNSLRGLDGLCPAGHQEARGLQFGEPFGVRDVGSVRLQRPGNRRRHPADGQPRTFHRCPLPSGWNHL